jgi:uncharacterized membrane protein
MENRPKIELTLSQFDKIIELVSIIFLIAMWLQTAYTLIKLPAIIPIHFNAAGKADNYGDKTTLLILPILATIIYFAFSALNKYPHNFNYTSRITAANAQQQYIIATRLLRFIKMAVLIIFNLIILFTYLTTIGVVNGLGIWLLPIVLGLMIVPVMISIVLSSKKQK